MPACAAPLVKSRTSTGICRNLNRALCFHDAHRFSEIGFVRRILPISPVTLSSSACFSALSGHLKGAFNRASWDARVDSGPCGGSPQSGDLSSTTPVRQRAATLRVPGDPRPTLTTSSRSIRSLIDDGQPATANRRDRDRDLALPQANRARCLSSFLILPISIMR